MNGDQSEGTSQVESEEVVPQESVETPVVKVESLSSSEVVEAPAKKRTVKKAAKKVAKVEVEAPVKKASRKVETKVSKAVKAPATEKSKKEGEKSKSTKKRAVVKDGVKSLSDAQVRILKVLSKSGHLTGQEIAKRANVNSTMIGNQAGYRNSEINERPVHRWNLLNRGYVKLLIPDEGSTQFRYAITTAGTKALAKE